MATNRNRLWRRLINWEQWPFSLRYALISPAWLWYCLRSGAVWFFTPSNPAITFGGFEGEGKKEMYDLLPPHLYPKTIFIQPGEPFKTVRKKIDNAGFSYPFCTKPDVGMKGLLFRKVDNEAQFETYHRLVPVTYMVQELVQYPLEVSVFYYRHPAQEKGVITGFTQKELLDVVGDGTQTLLELIQAHPNARNREAEMRTKHAAQLHQILPPGQRYPLAYAANLNRGARFINLQHLVDDDLLRVFDAISKPAQFYYGRYDLKCRSIDDLKKGQQFSILEFNGSGAEPNHVYQAGYSLFGALRVWLRHWQALYEISAYHAARGVPYWPFLKGWRFLQQAKKHWRLLEACEAKIPL